MKSNDQKSYTWYYYNNENDEEIRISNSPIYENISLFEECKDQERNEHTEEYKKVCEKELKIEGIEEKNRNWEKEFFNLIKKKVSNFLGSFPYNNIILFLGSGASIKCTKYGRTMADLVKEIQEDLKKKGLKIDYDKIFTLEELKRYDHSSRKVEDKKEFNLETVITQLELEKESKNTSKDELEKIINTLDYIKYIIFKKVNYQHIEVNDFSHGAVMNYLLKMLKDDDTKLNVITTNYDVVVEKIAAVNGYTVFDGFSFDSDHEFDDDIFEWNLTKSIKGVNTNELVYKKKVMNLLKIHGSIDWEKTGATVKKSSPEKMEKKLLRKILKENEEKVDKSREESEVMMIFPSSNKYAQSYKEPYFDLLHRFQDMLHIPNTLLITAGFSFSDDHLSEMIFNAIKHNEDFKCLVCDYNINPFVDEDDKAKNQNQKTLLELSKNGYQIGYLKAAMNDENRGLDFYFKGKVNEEDR